MTSTAKKKQKQMKAEKFVKERKTIRMKGEGKI